MGPFTPIVIVPPMANLWKMHRAIRVNASCLPIVSLDCRVRATREEKPQYPTFPQIIGYAAGAAAIFTPVINILPIKARF